MTTRAKNNMLRSLMKVALAVLILCSPALAQAPSSTQVESAFLIKFASYVDWPEKAFPKTEGPFIIGVLGTDPFGATLAEDVRGERAKGRPIDLQHYSALSQIDGCHILFVSSSEGRRLGYVLDKLKGRSILTVSDLPDFARAGGMIGFVTQNNKIRFQINREAAQAAGINISAKLLQLAQVVYPNPRP